MAATGDITADEPVALHHRFGSELFCLRRQFSVHVARAVARTPHGERGRCKPLGSDRRARARAASVARRRSGSALAARRRSASSRARSATPSRSTAAATQNPSYEQRRTQRDGAQRQSDAREYGRRERHEGGCGMQEVALEHRTHRRLDGHHSRVRGVLHSSCGTRHARGRESAATSQALAFMGGVATCRKCAHAA